MPKIIIESGPEKGGNIDLVPGRSLSFGREAQGQVVLTDAMTSRRHFAIESRPEGFFVKDLGSLNGTWVNGVRVQEQILTPGDRIQAGDTRFSFLEAAEGRTRGGLIGREIGGYQIEERLGRGGMGTVYRAVQKSLDRVVALKILAPELAKDQAFIARFLQEAHAAGKLNHPNIVRALDAGQADGLHYFSMEYVPGGSLYDQIRKGERLEPTRVVAILIDVARGLDFAEQNGIIHRDIKPENLMFDATGRAKIGDLGIAESLKARDAKSPAKGIFGTPYYMAPEQAAGRRLDHRADLYSLGATAYRALSGRPLFTGDSQEEIMVKHISEPHTPLKDAASDVPGPLCAVVERMLEKDREDRYPNAKALLADLEALQGGPPPRRAAAPRGRPARTTTASKVLLITTGLLLLAVLASLLVAHWVRRHPGQKDLVYWLSRVEDAPETAAAKLRLLADQYPEDRIGREARQGHQRALEILRQREQEATAQVEAKARLEADARRELDEIEQAIAKDPDAYDAIVQSLETLIRDRSGTQAAWAARQLLDETRRRREAESPVREDLAALAERLPDLLAADRFGEITKLYQAFLAAHGDAPEAARVQASLRKMQAKAQARFEELEAAAWQYRKNGQLEPARAVYRRIAERFGPGLAQMARERLAAMEAAETERLGPKAPKEAPPVVMPTDKDLLAKLISESRMRLRAVDFAAAEQVCRAGEPKLKTKAAQKAIAGRLACIRDAAGVHSGLVKAIREKTVDVTLLVVVPGQQIREVDERSFELIWRDGATMTRRWSSLPKPKLLKLYRVRPLSARDHLALAFLCTEWGLYDQARAEMVEAKDGGADVTLALAHLDATLRSEREARAQALADRLRAAADAEDWSEAGKLAKTLAEDFADSQVVRTMADPSLADLRRKIAEKSQVERDRRVVEARLQQWERQRERELKQDFRRHYRRLRDNPRGQIHLAACYQLFHTAIRTLEDFIRRRPGDWWVRSGEAYRELVDLYLRAGEEKRAASLLAKARRRGPGRLTARQIADLRAKLDTFPERLKTYRALQQKLERDLLNGDLTAETAERARELGFELDERLYRERLEKFSLHHRLVMDGSVLWRLAELDLGDISEAFRRYQQYEREFPESEFVKGGEVLWRRAELLRRQARWHQALALYRQMKEKYPEHDAVRRRGRGQPQVDQRIQECRRRTR